MSIKHSSGGPCFYFRLLLCDLIREQRGNYVTCGRIFSYLLSRAPVVGVHSKYVI